MSRIVWTPVPNGYRDGKLRISVLVSPKLSGPSTLDGYPAWLGWPSARPGFSVVFQDGATVPAAVVSPPPRAELWQRLFTATTPVLPKALALAAPEVPPIRSWPSSSARQLARAEHVTAMAYHPASPPTVNAHFPHEAGARRFDGAEPVTSIHLSDSDRENLTGLISQRLARDGYFLGGESLGFYSVGQVDFFLAEQFHFRRATDNPGTGSRSLAAQTTTIRAAQDLDFHAALGSIAQYPPLQRALGLVVDLELDPAATGLPVPSQAVLSLQVGLTTTEPYEMVYPAVAATLTKTAFRATPAGTTAKDGLLALGSGQFGVIEVDADAGAGGLSSFSDAVHVRRTYGELGVAAGQPGGVTDSGSEPAPLPANRNSGFSVAHFGRAKHLAEKLRKTTARMADLSALAADPHHAEDLTAGLRVDVFDVQAGRWYSLCRRRGTYDCNGLPFVPEEDEGLVALGHTEQGGDPTLYLHESLFTWNGYSLVTTRPGSAEELVNGERKRVGPDSEPTGPVKLKASFRAVGLPKLRYGRTYRFRARTVDVAGNGLGRDEPAADDFGAATPPVRYLRFEPVAAPLLLPTAPREGDEAVDVMVIRGNYDRPSDGERQRHLVPGAMTQLTAEQHGLFDVQPSPLNPGGMDKNAYAEIVQRDRARLDDLGKPDPDGWGEVRYFDVDTIDVPYLPDLLARGIALHGLPGLGKEEAYPVDLGNQAWPRRRGFRIRLVHGTGRPEWNSARRTLTVKLPPGKTAEVAYSHRIDAADLDLMGVWDWFLQSGLEPGGGRTVDDLRRLATEGRLWQLTPTSTRPLTLVHAVRQPMTPPVFAKPVAVRQPGETTARIIDVLRCDPDSTAQVDVLASWTEPVDVPADAGPKEVTGSATVASLPVSRTAPGADQVQLGDVQEFHDTKYRRITYSAEATSRFVPFYTRSPRIKLSGTTPVVLAPGGFAPSTVSVDDPLGERQYRRDLAELGGGAGDYLLDAAAGTIARSPSSSIPDGSEVDVSFVAGAVTRNNTEAQEPVVVDVRSSARPAMPDIAYLVPTFGWERADQPAGISSTRRGNGLRVYLRRPWYSSGDGEMLGVVLFDGNGTLPKNLAQYVTLRGQDPLFASSPTSRTPEIREFPLAVNAKAGYRLAESDVLPELTATVAIAPHRVDYDAGRRMWFCDLTMSQDAAYSPFLRLALARFQPMSLAGVEASPVVLAQFAQLNPDRTLSAVFDAAGTVARVTVTGTGYTADPVRAAKVKVLAQVSAGPKPPLDATGWRTAAATELAGASGGGQWSGEIPLPAPRGSQPMRLVVEERELGGSRLVYADAVEI